jgi:hypothetical protein
MTEREIKKLKLEFNEVICIVWRDIHTNAGWANREDLNKAECPTVKALGFFDGVRDDSIILKHNLQEKYDEADYTIIPAGCIVRIRRLKVSGNARNVKVLFLKRHRVFAGDI